MERDDRVDRVEEDKAGLKNRKRMKGTGRRLFSRIFLLLSVLFSVSFIPSSFSDEMIKPADMVLHHWKEGGAVFKIPPKITIEREDSEVFQGSSKTLYLFVGKIDSLQKPFDLVAETYWNTFAKRDGVLEDDFRNQVNGYQIRGLAGFIDGFSDPISLVVVGVKNPYGADYLFSLMFRGIKEPTAKTRSIFQEFLSSFSIVP